MDGHGLLYQFIQLFPGSIIFIYFSMYSHGILDVVFTHPVGYSRLPSAVNDPAVTKSLNSRESCLEEMFQIPVSQVALFYMYLVYPHGVFHRTKESTKNLSNSTMKKNSVPVVDFCESSWTFVKLLFCFNCCLELLLSLSIAAK